MKYVVVYKTDLGIVTHDTFDHDYDVSSAYDDLMTMRAPESRDGPPIAIFERGGGFIVGDMVVKCEGYWERNQVVNKGRYTVSFLFTYLAGIMLGLPLGGLLWEWLYT